MGLSMANAPTLTSGARFLTLLTTLWSVHVRSVCLVLLLLLLAGCGLWKKDSGVLLPVADLYQQGEEQLRRQRYEDARTTFKRLTESHADTEYAPRARFLIGEAFYREQNYDEAVKALQEFLTFYPAHPIADLAQYRLALSYYDQLQPVEKDQGLTAKALAEFQKLVKTYPESRYASDALAKMEICRLRLAQKELWVAQYYYDRGQYAAALQRLEAILKDYPRERQVLPGTLYLLGEIHFREGRRAEATRAVQRLVDEFPDSEWARRARQRFAGRLL